MLLEGLIGTILKISVFDLGGCWEWAVLVSCGYLVLADHCSDMWYIG